MALPDELLNEGEELVLYRHPHWSFMMSGFVMVLTSVIVAVFLGIVLPAPLNLLGLLIVIFALVGAAGRYLTWRSVEFAITTDRILVRRGVLTKHGMEIPLDRIMNISYRRSLYERLLGIGDLIVESAGETGHQEFTDVTDPSYVQNVIQRQTELYAVGRSGSVRTTDAPGDEGDGDARSSIPEQIEKLAELRDKGILSDAEFQEKKQMFLDRM